VNVTDTSLAALLLTNRIVDVGKKPLSAGEFWALHCAVDDANVLMGMTAEAIAAAASVPLNEAERYAALLGAGTAFDFERERLEEEGVRLISAVDDCFPARLRQRLRDACPAFLLVGGPADFLDLDAVGVVGSRNAPPEALEVAASVAPVAASNQWAVVSGLARGIDQTAMAAALDAGVPVVGVPTEGIRVVARNSEVRRHAHTGALCIASPYAPTMRFTAGNAMGRNKIVYALAEVTLVVCSDSGSGGTWEGARESIRRNFGPVAVWRGVGAGPGNAKLIEFGGRAVDEIDQLIGLEGVDDNPTPANQPSLFDSPIEMRDDPPPRHRRR
jgi:predicted Rossmann fold nucleotide-binding protein DprA/Smf involved in DNA uptake